MVIKDKFIQLLFIILVSNILTISCQNIKMEQKFDWSATLSAPKEYPVQVYEGNIIAKDYQQSFTGFGDINTGWGNYAASVIMGPDLKSIPDTLNIAWHSYVNQKNFIGKWKLPKEQIQKLFEEGFVDSSTNKEITYTTIVIGLSPNGIAVLWLQGGARQIEVAHFVATEDVNLDISKIENAYMFEKEYNDIVLSDLNEQCNTIDRIKQKTYPALDVYEIFRNRYLWKPLIELPNGNKLNEFVLHTYNGEVEIDGPNTSGIAIDYQKRAIIKSISFSWIDDHNKKVADCWLENFNENEIIKAYGSFNENEKIDLIIKIVNNSKVNLLLKSNDKEIAIKNFKTIIE
jgi:hypothetical protein